MKYIAGGYFEIDGIVYSYQEAWDFARSQLDRSMDIFYLLVDAGRKYNDVRERDSSFLDDLTAGHMKATAMENHG